MKIFYLLPLLFLVSCTNGSEPVIEVDPIEQGIEGFLYDANADVDRYWVDVVDYAPREYILARDSASILSRNVISLESQISINEIIIPDQDEEEKEVLVRSNNAMQDQAERIKRQMGVYYSNELDTLAIVYHFRANQFNPLVTFDTITVELEAVWWNGGVVKTGLDVFN